MSGIFKNSVQGHISVVGYLTFWKMHPCRWLWENLLQILNHSRHFRNGWSKERYTHHLMESEASDSNDSLNKACPSIFVQIDLCSNSCVCVCVGARMPRTHFSVSPQKISLCHSMLMWFSSEGNALQDKFMKNICYLKERNCIVV